MSELHEHDDSTLLDDFRDTRSEAAFTELVRRHLPLVFNVALRRLGSAALAEEAAQHAFACLASKVSAVARHPERLRAWLHRTAYFEASTLARKETRLSRLPVKPEPNIEPMNRPEIYDRLDEVLNKLPELDRELVLRHCCGGEDYRRMAAAVGKSEAACQKRVERALARLGQGLGGARTAGVVFAAFAATNMKSQAMPAAERVAAAALKYHTATGSVVGALSGMKLAACAALAMAGSAAAWPRSEPPPAPPAEVRSVAARSNATNNKSVAANELPLAPRPVSVNRPLDEVLESIQAKRIAPLIDFLPRATVADLRAIIAEDDVAGLGERMGGFGPARDLALRRWVEMDPEDAFRYGVSRDHEGGGDMRNTTLILAKWILADAESALAAYTGLSTSDRQNLIYRMLGVDDGLAGRIAAGDPAVDWIVREHRLLHPATNRLIEIAEPPVPAANLPPGARRTLAAGREAEELMTRDPEAAIRRLQALPTGAERDAVFKAVSGPLAGGDPWRLIELVAAMRGTLDDTGDSGLERALLFAGKKDPLRALALLPQIAAKCGDTRSLAGEILSGWMELDALAAIQWAGKAGIEMSSRDLAKATATTEALVAILDREKKSERQMAQEALQYRVQDGLADGTAATILAGIPQPLADEICSKLVNLATGENHHDEALQIAAMASPAIYQKLLPEIGLNALGNDPTGAVDWLRTLPAADQRMISTGVERLLVKWDYWNAPDIRQLLEKLTP